MHVFERTPHCLALDLCVRIRSMDVNESTLRSIKDRIATVLGTLNDAISDIENKENYRRLTAAAQELHRCADDIQNVLMRIKPRE